MTRFLSWLVTLPVLLVVLIFALENRDAVTLNFWPFDVTVTTPLSFLAVGLLFLGLVMGSFATWIATLHSRLEASRLRREVEDLRRKLAASADLEAERFAAPPQSSCFLKKLFHSTGAPHADP